METKNITKQKQKTEKLRKKSKLAQEGNKNITKTESIFKMCGK